MVIGKCTGDRGSLTVASMLRTVFRNCEFKKINVSLSFFQQAFTRISYKSKKNQEILRKPKSSVYTFLDFF